MGTLFLNQIKKQACSFLQEKYKTARLALTNATQAELLAEEATNNDPWGPDAKTMTIIAAASFDIDDYWKVVDVLHKRFESVNWKQWRQSYKSLVLIEFLLTHGPEEFAEEFQRDSEFIEELGTFNYIDEKGFNWGANMRKRSDHILKLLQGGVTLREARLKALKITKEIQGFGSSSGSPSWPPPPPPPSSSPSSSTSNSSVKSSFGSFSTTSSTFNDIMSDISGLEQLSLSKENAKNYEEANKAKTSSSSNMDLEGPHLWDFPPIQEVGCLLDSEEDEEEEKGERRDGFVGGIYSKIAGISPSKKCFGEKAAFRSFSNVGRLIKKKLDRQFSLGY